MRPRDAEVRVAIGRARRRAAAVVRTRLAVGIRSRLPRGPRRAPGGQRLARRGGGARQRRAVRRRRRRSRLGGARRRPPGAASEPRRARSCSTTPTTPAPRRWRPRSQALASVGADGRRIAVLGEMRELGAQSDEEHAIVGRLAADAGLDLLVVVGSGASPLADAARATRAGRRDRDARRRRPRSTRWPAASVPATPCWSRAVGPSGSTSSCAGSPAPRWLRDRSARELGGGVHAVHPRHPAAHPDPGTQQHRSADPRRRPVRASSCAEGGNAHDGRHRDRRRHARRVSRRAHPHRAAAVRARGHHADGADHRHGDRRSGRRLPGRAQGAQHGPAQARQDRRRAHRGRRLRVARARSTSTCRPTCRSPGRSTSTSVRGCGSSSRSR